MSAEATARPQMARPIEVTSKAGRSRWSPDARTREAIRVLVEQAPPLNSQQRDQLRAVLARPVAEASDRAVKA